jgi:hypothetical protein
MCGHGYRQVITYVQPGLALMTLHVLATGPQVLSEAFKVYMETTGGPVRDARVRDGGRLTPHVYQLGEFYLPCNWLSQELCADVDNADPKPANLAGFHHWAGSWKIS